MRGLDVHRHGGNRTDVIGQADDGNEIGNRIHCADPIVPLEKFYPAEDYHQDYFANNPNQGYCQFVVKKKVEHFKEALEKKGEKPKE